LIYRMSDSNKVFVDGRGDLYERQGVLADYLSIMRLGPAAPVLLDSYGVQSCLIGHDEPLRTFLEATPGWQKVYADPLSDLYVRTLRPAVSLSTPVEANAKASEPHTRAVSTR